VLIMPPVSPSKVTSKALMSVVGTFTVLLRWSIYQVCPVKAAGLAPLKAAEASPPSTTRPSSLSILLLFCMVTDTVAELELVLLSLTSIPTCALLISTLSII